MQRRPCALCPRPRTFQTGCIRRETAVSVASLRMLGMLCARRREVHANVVEFASESRNHAIQHGQDAPASSTGLSDTPQAQ